MKKFLKTGKKTLSVFMAVLMAFTALVFAAPEVKAASVSAGNYYIKITWHMEDNCWIDQTYTTNATSGKDRCGFTVTYKTNNGAGSTGTKDWVFKSSETNDKGKATQYATATIPGFPTNIHGYINNDSGGRGTLRVTKVELGTHEGNLRTIFTGEISIASRKNSYYFDLSQSGCWRNKTDKDNWNKDINVSAWTNPTATSVVWTKTPNDITIPKDETSVSTIAESYCVDQYGARLAADPTYTVTYDPSEPTEGLGVSTNADSEKASVTVSANKKACLPGNGNNTRLVTVRADYNYNGTPTSTNTNPVFKTFKISDPSYTVSLLDNVGEIKTETPLTKQWGDSYGTAPYAVRDGYTLIGFYPASEGPQGPFNDGESQPSGNPLTADYVIYEDSSWYPVWRVNQYKATFNYKNENYKDTSYVADVYVGSEVKAPDIPKEISPNVDHTYTFTGWDSEIVATMPAHDVTYTAQYSDTIHYADYTEVVNQINAANAKKSEALYQESAYTQETVNAFENALKTAVDSNNNKLLKSQQSQVDTIAENLKSARENLKLKTFTVLFVDESGAIIKDGYFYVNYGYKVEVPTAPEKDFDANYHYKFTGWDSDSNELSECDKVTDNLKYIAKFNAVEHVFTDTVTPSDCSADGVIKHTCDCGYSYTSVSETDKAHHTWSDDYKELVPATCATAGSKAKYCTVCGTIDESSKTVIDPLGHNFGEWVEEISATCTGRGMKVKTCSRCGGKEVEEIDVAGHKWGDTTVVAPTCTVGGYSTHTCTECGITEIFDLTDATGHNLSTKTTVAATCVAAGYKETTCSNAGCDYDVVETIPATGEHTYGDEIVLTTANCISDGVSEKECSVCHKVERTITPKLTEHTFGDWTTLAAETCFTDRIEQRVCGICGTTETRTIDNTAHHTWADGEYTEDIPATCTTDGSKSIHCTICGASKADTVTEIKKLGHNYDGARTETHKRDCVNGTYTKTFCTREGCDHFELTFAEGEEGEALGHDFSVEKSTVAATCEQDGSKVMQCSRCDETETVVLPKLGHNFIAGEEVPATCTTSAYTVMKCSHDGCNKTYNEYKGDPKGHTWGDWVVTKPSTNTEAGEMQHTCIVDGCNATETAAIPAGGHSFEGAKGVVILAATCHSKGTTKYTCTAHKDAEGNNTCGVSITVETAETPHSLATSITDPKCERIDNGDGTYKDVFTEGEIKVYCTNSGCGYVDKSASCVLAAPSDHTWTAWQTRTEATCNADGIKVRYCKKCGVEETEKITTRPNHEFIATVVAPTCEERGFTTYACKGCGLTYRDDFTNALGHDYDEGVPVEATCTTPGGILYTCKRVFQSEKIVDGEKVYVDVPCGHTKFVEDESKPATGHSMGEWKFVEHPYDKENAYAKERICMNAGCTYSEYETGAGEDHEINGVNAYYKVTFYNEWVTDTYDELKDHRIYSNPNDEAVYTKLSKTYKTVELASIYVLKNTEAVYPNKIAPKREKDADWGGYFFEGWTKTANEVAVGKDDAASPADLSRITANTDLYALFKCRDVYYKVRFYNPDGKPLTKETVILHGHSAEWPESFGTPTMPDNITWKYTFKGWAYDYTKIYDDVAIMAVYDATAKKYNIEYYNDAGKLIGTETVVNGQKLSTPEITPLQKEDKKYVYIFTGTWTLDNGAPVNTEHFAVPAGSNEGDTIKVHAKYSKRQKVYPVKLHIVDPYDASAPLEGVSVQVMDSKGQLIATGETDANGDVSFSLYYDQFTFSASRGNYYFEGKMSFDNNVPGNAIKWTVPDNIYMGTIQLAVKENPDEGKKCGCICHTFLGGIWITFMNILYKVFGVKHVCCYDMYAVHGDKLTYGRS